MANAEIETIAAFANESGIANLKREVTRMGTEVIQLVERWCAIRMRVIGHERAALQVLTRMPAAPEKPVKFRSGRMPRVAVGSGR